METSLYKDLETKIGQFESKLLEALEFKYGSEPQQVKTTLIEMSPVKRIDIKKFWELYFGQKIYPQERIEKLVYQLFDIKIQMFYIVELDIGLYNRLIYDLGFNNTNLQDFPYVHLRKLSLDQTLIVKSRILWERVMNLIYYLEKGEDLEEDGGSKKTRFFNFIKGTKWAYLREYKNYIYWFDDKLRTPEVHKSSLLRKHFQQESNPNDDKIMGLINIIMNSIWTNLLEIIQGHEPSSGYWDIAMENS